MANLNGFEFIKEYRDSNTEVPIIKLQQLYKAGEVQSEIPSIMMVSAYSQDIKEAFK